jgi:hypothetical protein
VVVAVEVNCNPVLVVAVVIADPELVLKVTFRVFALHLANKVKLPVTPTTSWFV